MANSEEETSLGQWMTSLHGGHSGEFCDHAEGTLLEILDMAVRRGCSTYGVSEHAPRVTPELLYDEERAMGWTNETLLKLFEAYAERVDALAKQFQGRLTVLCGFESEAMVFLAIPRALRKSSNRRALLRRTYGSGLPVTISRIRFCQRIEIQAIHYKPVNTTSNFAQRNYSKLPPWLD